MTEQFKKFIEWDGKIPAWGIILLGLSAVLYGWNWVADIDRRVDRSEAIAAQYRAVIEVKLSRVETVVDRIERKLDGVR